MEKFFGDSGPNWSWKFFDFRRFGGGQFENYRLSADHLNSLIETLHFSGVKIEVGDNWLAVKNNAAEVANRNAAVNPVREQKFSNGVNIKTKEYPGFPTDLQTTVSILTQVSGESLVHETFLKAG